MNPYYVLEFTDDRSRVHRDITPGSGAHAVAKEYANEFGGIVYWVEGPFRTEQDAREFLDSAD